MNEPLFQAGKSVPRIPLEVSALLSALQINMPDLSLLQALSDDEWDRLLVFTNPAHLTLPLAQLPTESFPSWVVEKLNTNRSDNARRFDKIKALYQEAAEALNQAEIEHIVIKGFSQSPDYVPDPRRRSQSDIDIYCPRERISDAQEALQRIGYMSVDKRNGTFADHVPTLIRLGEWAWKGNPFDPEMPLGIELHFCLWNESVSHISIPEVESFWRRRTTREVDGLVFSCLNPIDHLGHLALHILRNLFLSDWIVHHVRELALFLDSHIDDDVFWQNWSETHSCTLRSYEAIAFYLAHSWFNCRLPPLVEHEISSLPVAWLSWLDHFSGSALEVMFRQNKDSMWLQLRLLSSRRAKWQLALRTLVARRVASIHSPIVGVRNKRLVRPSSQHLWLRYLAYLASRSVSHGRASVATIFRGLGWHLSRYRLPAQFWIFLTASFFFNLGLSIYYFLFNLFLIGHGYGERELGLITSAMALGNVAGALPAGRLANRLGLRRVLLTCFAAAVVVCSTRALLLSLYSQLALAFLAGVVLSAWAVCISPAIAQLTEKSQRPRAFSLVFSLGIGLGALGGQMGSRLPGWIEKHHLLIGRLLPDQIVLLISCGIVAIGIWPALKLGFDRPYSTRGARLHISPFLLRYLPAIAAWTLVTGSFSPLASVYLARHVHLSLPQIGNAFSASQIAQVAAVLLAPALFRRWGLINGIITTQVAAAGCLLALASISRPLPAAAAYISLSAFQWMNEPGLYSLLMNKVPPEDRSGSAASNSFVMSSSQVVAATLAGSAFVRYGYPTVLNGIAVLALIAAVLFWKLQDRPEREQSLAIDDAAS